MTAANNDRHTITRDKDETSLKAKPFPKLYDSVENCCGCSACYAICPAHAITMDPDDEGFLYPTVDAEKCIRCYQCITVCAFKVDQERKGYYVSYNDTDC